jgi:hypothetical protein
MGLLDYISKIGLLAIKCSSLAWGGGLILIGIYGYGSHTSDFDPARYIAIGAAILLLYLLLYISFSFIHRFCKTSTGMKKKITATGPYGSFEGFVEIKFNSYIRVVGWFDGYVLFREKIEVKEDVIEMAKAIETKMYNFLLKIANEIPPNTIEQKLKEMGYE